MTVKRKRFVKGIELKPEDLTSEDLSREGEVSYDSSDKKLKYRDDVATKEVLTSDGTQTLENKTIDADNNTVNNIETDNLKAGVLNTDLSGAATDTEIPSALAVKTALEAQDDASEITYNPASNPETIQTNLQGALDDTGIASQAAQDAADAAQSTADNHIADVADAHTASAITNVPSGNLAATDVQSALDELQTELDTKATDTALTNHLNDAIDAHDASAISNVPAGNLAATDVQGALNELQSDIDTRATSTELTDHINDVADAHAASAITNTPSGNLAATDVQGALNELQTELDSAATDADLTAHTGTSSGVHGVTGSVVGTTDTQTLTNKTVSGGTVENASIEAPSRLDVKQDTQANLETYAATASNGQVVFATDTKRMFQIIDNDLRAIGGGGFQGAVLRDIEDLVPTVSNVVAAEETTTFLPVDENSRGVKATFSGSDGSIRYEQTVSADLDGQIGVASVWLKTSLSNITLSTTIDGVIQNSISVEDTNKWKQYEIPMTLGAGDYGFQLDASGAAAGDVFIDEAFVKTTTLPQGNNGAFLVADDSQPTGTRFTNSVIGALGQSTEWEDAGALTIEATGTNPTKGTTEVDKVWVRRVGDSLEVRMEYQQNTGGTAGSGDYLFKMPTGYKIDTTKVTTYSVIEGTGSFKNYNTVGSVIYTNAVNSPAFGGVSVYDEDSVRIFIGNDDSQRAAVNSGFADLGSQVTTGYQLNFTVPIQGWISTTQAVIESQQLNSSTANHFNIRVSSTGTITNDDLGILSSCTRDALGDYSCSYNSSIFTSEPTLVASACDNGRDENVGFLTNTTSGFSYTVRTLSNTNQDKDVCITVSKTGADVNKQLIITAKAEELVKVSASGTVGEAITANTENIRFNEVSDNYNVFDNFIFTVPTGRSGKYLVSGSVRQNPSSGAVLFISKSTDGGATFNKLINLTQNSSANASFIKPFSQQLVLNAGDKIAIRVDAGITTENQPENHYLEISELPDSEYVTDKDERTRKDQYSETEIPWGLWNGEQLYRKCFPFSSRSDATVLVTGVDKMVNVKGYCRVGSFDRAFPFSAGSDFCRIEYDYSNNEIETNSNRSYSSEICVEYTKI